MLTSLLRRIRAKFTRRDQRTTTKNPRMISNTPSGEDWVITTIIKPIRQVEKDNG